MPYFKSVSTQYNAGFVCGYLEAVPSVKITSSHRSVEQEATQLIVLQQIYLSL